MCDSGFVKADSDNLLAVDAEMVNQFYLTNVQFLDAETRNVKSKKASNKDYADNAINYVQLQRIHNICTVKCKITPEHKVHRKAYTVIIGIDEKEEKIIRCECLDCAASLGGCKHSVAFLFWLHRRSEEPSTTSKECYWKASKLSTDKYMSLNQIVGKNKSCVKPTDMNIVSSLVDLVGKREGGIFDLFYESDFNKFDIFQLILKYKAEHDQYSPEEFIDFAQASMNQDLSIVEEHTREQYKSGNWYKIRFGRVTASKIYEVAKCKTGDGVLLEAIMGASKPLETEPVCRGRNLERLVVNRVEKMKKIKISEVGILLNKDYPVLAASPDGLSMDYCVEVKCPSKEKTVENYFKNNTINRKYYYQLQLQMLFAKKDKGLFCIASPNFESDGKVNIIEVDLEKENIDEIVQYALTYWKTYVFDKLINI